MMSRGAALQSRGSDTYRLSKALQLWKFTVLPRPARGAGGGRPAPVERLLTVGGVT